eukprot:scaffold34937_cov165-Amphora_coffeaeformis.AAC.2
MQTRKLLLYYHSSLIALLLYLTLPTPSTSLLLFRSNPGTPPPSPPSPSKWLAKVIWDDGRNITVKKNEIQLWHDNNGKEGNEHEEISVEEKKHWAVKSMLRVRSFLLVQVIRFVLLFHIEGPVLRNLSNKILFEIIQECLMEEARPQLLRVVATELDRRRQAYEFGDVSRYTWKQFTQTWKRQFGNEYQFGDITRGVLERAARATDSERWRNRINEEMEGLQKQWGKQQRKWRLKVMVFRKKRG